MKKLINKKENTMKKLMLVVGIMLLGSEVKAQTTADALKIYNDTVCETVGAVVPCSDAQHLAAWCAINKVEPCVDTRAVDSKVYSTPTAWNAAVNAPLKNREVFTKRKEELLTRLVQIARNNNAKCVDIMTAAGLDTLTCK